ncbi:NAD-dependent succinate-semialdehyde dehydrogenase [Dietzia sp. B32]|uniref:NAD-dependent succinate-semialdehyde dehydrogenase n=1 Tax=Dietzia sp. B32 TaxID=2915130 RepID=UPI0021ADB9EE|nr:NAD-dependent succinate-semialdehyde dehydrogenase [Dietzia sp. B32]UVE93828.1 NAD-dependent succinate-semialdehyde dehydrogenase [Dietzia sp. B32]
MMLGLEDTANKLFIGGEWRKAGDGEIGERVNPANDQRLASIPRASSQDLDDALSSSADAFRVWGRKPAVQRVEVLRRAAELLRQRADDIATIITLEQGKTLTEASLEVALAAETFEWFAGESLRAGGQVLPARIAHSRQMVITQPVGPVLAIAPWNFPLLLPTRKVAAALAAGCTVIVKPAGETPGAVQALAHVLSDAGLEAGAFNVVLGASSEISEKLIGSPVIRKISFTGSTEVGRRLSQLAADYAKPSTMELGGHAPVVVFDDVDLEKAVATCLAGKTRNAGQVCTSPTRFIVHDRIFDAFVADFGRALEAVSVGDGSHEGTQMGPLVNHRRVQAMEQMVDDAVGRGAKLVTGGNRIGEAGSFFQPTLLADVPVEAESMQSEPFGPLAIVNRFETIDEALEESHRLDVGLAAYVFTASANTALTMSDALQAGGIGINSFSVSSIEAPFGGMKDSGHGYEGGTEGLHGYLHHKYINHVV